MRFKYILILLLGCCCWRCNSIDDRFEEKDNLRLIMLEAIEEPYANPKDVYVYKLMAQSMSGLERVVISNVSHELDSAPALPTIVLVDSVTVDSNGYLSRPVKTAIIEYPIVVPPSARRINQPGFYGNCRQWEIPDYNLFDAGC